MSRLNGFYLVLKRTSVHHRGNNVMEIMCGNNVPKIGTKLFVI